MTTRIIPFIFSWENQFDNAKRNEDQLKKIFNDVLVINSDPDNSRNGWININKNDHFTKQFFTAANLFDGDILFHLQADASYDDWQSVVDNALKYFHKYNWGIFAPNVHFTAWGPEHVDIASTHLAEPELSLVSCTDCTCWFIHADIIDQCVERQSLFANNIFGWGIDLTMTAISYLHNRPVIRDYSHTIVHRRGTGYDTEVATAEFMTLKENIDEELKPILHMILSDRQALSQMIWLHG